MSKTRRAATTLPLVFDVATAASERWSALTVDSNVGQQVTGALTIGERLTVAVALAVPAARVRPGSVTQEIDFTRSAIRSILQND